MMTDREWIRTLPLLLVGGVAFCVGALIFWQKGDTTASIAAMTLGVVLVSAWATTAIADWGRTRRQPPEGWIKDEPMEVDDGGPA